MEAAYEWKTILSQKLLEMMNLKTDLVMYRLNVTYSYL